MVNDTHTRRRIRLNLDVDTILYISFCTLKADSLQVVTDYYHKIYTEDTVTQTESKYKTLICNQVLMPLPNY